MRTIRAGFQTLALTTLAATMACARVHEGADPVVQQSFTTSRGDNGAARIVAADLRKVNGSNALDAVRQLRPEFLRVTTRRAQAAGTSSSVTVYENGKFMGGVEALSAIPLAVLVEIRRIEPVEAAILFGSLCSCDGGVILVRTQP